MLLASGAAPSGAGALDVLVDLAAILCVAAVTTVIFRRIRQPIILGYLLAGLAVGPHLPVPIFADPAFAHEMSEIGVILLMFSLGLEFSLRKLIRVAPTAGLIAVIQCSLMIWLGYVTGQAFGWTAMESFFAGALIAISSTTIIVKAFAEQRLGGPVVELVFGILIVEDLIAILLLAVLTPIGSGAGLSASGLALAVGKLLAFLIGLLVVGILVVPRLVRMVVRMQSAETTVIVCTGVCFGFALVALKFGYSVALGAFLAGALVSESGEAKQIEHLMEPVRDVFAAIFFVSVGMQIDPALVARHWLAVVVLTAVVVVGKIIGVTAGAFLVGAGVRTSVQAGMSLAQIGEFSFIIAGVGLSLGAVRDFLYPVAVAVSALTTLVTPWLIRLSIPVSVKVDRRLPQALQTFVALYGSWIEGLRSARERSPSRARIRRLVRLLLVDLVAIVSIAIGAGVGRHRLIPWGVRYLELPAGVAGGLVLVAALALAEPFVLGVVRTSRALGVALAAEVIPSADGKLDLGAAPRRALVVTIQLAALLVVCAPVAALTQPFVGTVPSIVVPLVGLGVLGFQLWQSAANLHGHVRAGAQVIVEALARQTRTPGDSRHPSGAAHLVPGLENTTAVRIEPGHPSVGRTLKEIDLRGVTGATVIAIDRQAAGVVYPTADETLRENDVVVLTGSKEAVSAARTLLGPPGGP
jgi:CPA2 family monovalent cation:H+ antiporter-2